MDWQALGQILLEFIEKYFFIVAALAIFLLLSSFFNFYQGLVFFFKTIYQIIYKILDLTFKISGFLLIKLWIYLKSLTLDIISAIKRFIRKFYLRKSFYNVRPVKYKFNFFYRLIHPTLRKQIKHRYYLIESCLETHDIIKN